MKTCPVCQTKFKDKTKICRYCGVELEAMPSAAQQKATVTRHPKGKKATHPAVRQTKTQKLWQKYGYLIYFICILIIVLSAGSYFLSHKKVTKPAGQASQGIQQSTMENPDIQASETETPESASASNSTAPLTAYDWFNNAFKLCPAGQCSDVPKAIEYLDQAIKLKPDYAEAFNNRGIIYFGLGQYQRAIEDYNEAIRFKPQRAESYNNRGITYYKMGEYQRAIEDFNQAILLRQNYAVAYGNRGSTYLSLNQYQNAIENYNEAIHLKPDIGDYYKDRGTAYMALGNKNMGCPDLNKVCELGKCESLEKAQAKGLCP